MLEKILIKEVVAPILIILFSILFYLIITKIIKKFFNIKSKRLNERKKKTILNAICTIVKVFIFLIALVMILEVYGISSASIVTSLGAVSVVVGLAFQDLLKDFIAGFTILFEDQFSVGDVVTIEGFTGTVIDAGLKTTRIKAYTGEVKIVSNRNIVTVINHNLHTNVQILDVSVSYDSNLELVQETLDSLCNSMSEELSLPTPATCLGVEQLSDSSVVFRVAIPAAYGDKFGFARVFRGRIKEAFTEKGIEIPYPQVVVHNEQ